MPEVPQPEEMHVGLNTIRLISCIGTAIASCIIHFFSAFFQGLVYYRHSQLHVRKKKKEKKKLDGSFSTVRSVSTPDPQRLLSLETPVP